MNINVSQSITPIASGVDLLRADIDRIDDQILALLEQRYPLVERIARAKNIEQEQALPLRPARERGIVERLSAKAVGVPAADIRQIWRSIFSLSARHQRAYRVVLWGPESARMALSTLAAARYGGAVTVQWAATAAEAWREAEQGDAILMLPEEWRDQLAGDGLDLIERHASDCADHPWLVELGRLGGTARDESAPASTGWRAATWTAPTDGTVAYLGGHGSFSEEACLRVAPAMELQPLSDFEAVTRAVREGSADLGLVPLENSLVGAIPGVRELLAHPELRLVGEEVIEVRLHLLGVEGATLDTIARVESHPAALGQCADWLASRPWSQVAVASTSDAAGAVASARDLARAAIGSEAAAIYHGLTILARDLQGTLGSTTRFAILERRDQFA